MYRHSNFVHTYCSPDPDLKFMERNLMNYMGIFGILVFVAVAVNIPI
jgi:hypothetical protein